ncbi:MAG: hypothetical protein Q9162_007195, partial [Coniocarpon cinnabarinum]
LKHLKSGFLMPHQSAILNFLPPVPFRVESSLLAIGDEQSDACQNIRPGSVVLDALSKPEYSGRVSFQLEFTYMKSVH